MSVLERSLSHSRSLDTSQLLSQSPQATRPQSSTPPSSVPTPPNGTIPHPYAYGAYTNGYARSSLSSQASGPPISPPLWTHRVSSSLSVLAEQLLSTSRAIAQLHIPSATPSEREHVRDDVDSFGVATLNERVEAIESMQERLYNELKELKENLANPPTTPRDERPAATQAAAQNEITEVQAESTELERIAKELKELQEKVKLGEQQLYARLHNASATIQKTPIKALVASTGKPPANFPATRGEFEHLTKERYEAILKVYGLPTTGDTAAKRERLREYLGLPSD